MGVEPCKEVSPRLDERGFVLLTGHWRTLQHFTASPSEIGDIARPALVSPIWNAATSHETVGITQAYSDRNCSPTPVERRIAMGSADLRSARDTTPAVG